MNPISQTNQEKPLKSNPSNLFKRDPALGLSRFRVYVLRFYYVIIILMLGIQVWQEIFTHEGNWQPLPAVAYSFWGAFTLLAILGLIHPVKMIPMLLVQFLYKLIWLVMVAYPLWKSHQLTASSAEGLFRANWMGVIIDLLVIPWSYVYYQLICFTLVRKGEKARG